MDAVIIGGCGVFFASTAWWMRTHEWSATRADREGFEAKPSRFREWNFRASKFLNHTALPLALAVLALLAFASAMGLVT